VATHGDGSLCALSITSPGARRVCFLRGEALRSPGLLPSPILGIARSFRFALYPRRVSMDGRISFTVCFPQILQIRGSGSLCENRFGHTLNPDHGHFKLFGEVPFAGRQAPLPNSPSYSHRFRHGSLLSRFINSVAFCQGVRVTFIFFVSDRLFDHSIISDTPLGDSVVSF